MITPEQKQELTGMAQQVKFKVSNRGPKITLSSKCATYQVPNNEDGYKAAKERLEGIIQAQRPKEQTTTCYMCEKTTSRIPVNGPLVCDDCKKKAVLLLEKKEQEQT